MLEHKACLSCYCRKLSIHFRTSSSVALPGKRFPAFHSPLPASVASLVPVEPMPLLPDVQNGMTVAVPKSYASTNVSMMRGSCVAQIGYPM